MQKNRRKKKKKTEKLRSKKERGFQHIIFIAIKYLGK